MDLTKIDNISFSDVDHSDYPEYCDTYISSANYDGIKMTEDELNELNNYPDFIHEQLIKSLW